MNQTVILNRLELIKNQSVGIFFYNRSDFKEILQVLSPLRPYTLLAIPKLYYIGIITNILAIIVLLQPQILKKKSIFSLVFLAFSDLLYNIMSQLPQTLIDLNFYDYDIFKRSNLSCFFYDLRVTTFHFYSVILTLYVTLERFLYIYRPLKLDRGFGSLKSKTIVCISFFFASFILALPHGFLMVYSEVEKDCDARAFFKKKFFNTTFSNYQIYFTFTEPIVIWFIPGLLILVMNSYVIFRILKSSNMKNMASGNFYN